MSVNAAHPSHVYKNGVPYDIDSRLSKLMLDRIVHPVNVDENI